MCLIDEKKTLGMIRVETESVISACNRTLNDINKRRSTSRRTFCNQWLASATKSWQRYWRWFGFRKPVLRNALFEFYHSRYHHFPPSFYTSLTWGLQEQDCRKLLRAAKATKHRTMWISTTGASICGL